MSEKEFLSLIKAVKDSLRKINRVRVRCLEEGRMKENI